jgi:tetratricopeptide (TPR) repeat protein
MMTLQAGELIASRYAIDRAAGSGGMGTIYRARDLISGEWVALKLLNAVGVDGSDSERFAREAQILSELRHPGIVSHVAHGKTPHGLRFLAMQWLEGEDLGQRLSRAPLLISDALRLIQHVAEALAFAHERGVVHRDIKPTNIFLPGGEVSRVKVLDFGIARRLATSRVLTRTGMVVGTPEYMAPEQARGERELSPAADIFSLGCVLYECLTGEPPFVAEHIAAVLVRILFEEPASVAQRRPGLPEAVSELLARMLVKDPRQRIGDAREVAAALSAVETSQETPQLTTMIVPIKTPSIKPDDERVLLSLVLALSPRDLEVDRPTMSPTEAMAEQARHAALLVELRATGAQADLLLGGALVVTAPQMASAQDQAVQAARCAAMIKDRWPEAQVVVVTGRGSRIRGGLTGEVLDRAWRLVRNQEPPASPPHATSTQVRIDQVSAGLLGGRFEVAPLSATEVGFALGSERLESDAGWLLLGKPTACVGRERELTTLDALYSECKDELVARAVLVLGPPGSGKSRLRHEFLRRLENRSAQGIVLIGRGDPMKVKAAYGMLGEALRKRLHLREGQELSEQRARIRQGVAAALPASDALRVTVFIGEICGVPFPDEESPQLRAARQDPRIMSDQVERAWLDGLQLLRTDEPLLLILEDLHWGDALTVRLVEAALRRLRDHAFMVLALARPEVLELYPNLWSGVVQPLPMHPLPRKASERLVRQILGPEVSTTQLSHLVEQSAGNPLFLEELIRAAVERKTGELPETVTAMIQARIGRLPAGARRALRAASVFGETFWENGVWSLLAVTHGDEPMRSTLADLIRDEIIEKVSEGRFVNESQYLFRHALVRDAVYGLVSEDEKVAWHAAAGSFLEAAGEREASILAEHYQLGNQLSHAVRCYARAAEQAYDAGSIDAAWMCVERGLACGATGERRGDLLSIQCLIMLWREQFDKILTAGREALSLLHGGSNSCCRVLYPLMVATVFLDPGGVPALLTQLLRVEPEREALSTYFNAVALYAMAFISIGQKDPTDLLRHRLQEVSKELSEQDQNAWVHYFFVEGVYHDYVINAPHTCVVQFERALQATSRAGNNQIHTIATGYFSRALMALRQRADPLPMLRSNILRAEQANDPMPLGYARAFLAHWLSVSPNPDDWEEASQIARLACQSPNPNPAGQAHRALAQVAFARGDLVAAEAEARSACQVLSMSVPNMTDFTSLLARILRAQGKDAESLSVCEETMQKVHALHIEPYGLLDLYVALAESRERVGQPEAARESVEQALPILKRRLDDIPDSDMRAAYLREVPENARLLELASQWGIDAMNFNP